MSSTSRLGLFLAISAFCWHVLTVLSPAWVIASEVDQARDFASYYYAVKVGRNGGDPYTTKQLNLAAKEDGYHGVHPFLYAPPFLLGAGWVTALSLPEAYRVWFWLDEGLALAAVLVLWLWWRPFSESAAWTIAILFALFNAVPNNHAMGQANFAGLLLAFAGLWQTEKGRPWLGGALMGAACMMKMSPALFVFWWLVRREWRAVAASIACAVALSVLSLPWASPAVQLRFYTEVLPTFSTGEYNGLAVAIDMFGNHSVPNLFNQLSPAQNGALSPLARGLSSLFSFVSLGTLAYLFREPTMDPFQRAAQASAFGVLLLLIPVYTYEHHLVFALLAAVLVVLAVERGDLAGPLAIVAGLCIGVLLFDLQYIKAISRAAPGPLNLVGGFLQETKTIALFGLLGISAWLGGPAARRAARDGA